MERACAKTESAAAGQGPPYLSAATVTRRPPQLGLVYPCWAWALPPRVGSADPSANAARPGGVLVDALVHSACGLVGGGARNL